MSWIRTRNCVTASAAALASLGAGLASADTQSAAPTGAHAAVETRRHAPIHRHGRFALVEMEPRAGQRDLLQQVIEIGVPDAVDATVGDGLRHLLARSGYRLCESAEATELYELPLPAAHLRLGPLTLRDALTTMAGSAWALSVDEVSRMVCFARSASSGGATVPATEGIAPGGQP